MHEYTREEIAAICAEADEAQRNWEAFKIRHEENSSQVEENSSIIRKTYTPPAAPVMDAQTQAKIYDMCDERIGKFYNGIFADEVGEQMSEYVHKHVEAMARAIIHDTMAEHKKLRDQLEALSLRIDIEILKQQKKDAEDNNVAPIRSRNAA
jgi:hypothetical protein